MPQPVKSKENARSMNDLLADLPNPNITLFHETGSWSIYIALVAFCRVLVGLFVHEPDVAWAITNTVHNVVTYVAFHFVKGTPFDQDQGAYASQTYWEQLDYGKQYTATRKFYTAVPIVLLVIANHYCSGWLWWFNVVQFAIILIAKLPMMHRVRLFGIGKY